MNRRQLLSLLSLTLFVLFLFLIFQPFELEVFKKYIDILYPAGPIGLAQRDLLFLIQGLMLLVVVPVFILLYAFSYIYRADNEKSNHDPNLSHLPFVEYIWWGIPLFLIVGISVAVVIKTFELDPYKPLPSEEKELKVQVVALQWRWLFIYPEEGVASMNFLQIPVGRPIHFEITADAPMNSFWIPKLGGQIYAMPKMRTNLHLQADVPGDFRGSSANISGKGFAKMHFITRASSSEDFEKWISDAKQSEVALSFEEYTTLAKPSEESEPQQFTLTDQDLFEKVMLKFMKPPSEDN